LDAAAVSVVIPGIKTVAHADENIAAVDLDALTDAERKAIGDIVESAMDDFF
jgi:aryl-alcohol dehydrogenase-like predicted oxidoreductase